MTTKHVPLCSTKGCPHPSDPDWHIPICGHGLAYEHHHTLKRSRGGALSLQVCICPRCHHQIDNGPWMDGVYDHKDGTVHYFIKDAKGEDKCDVVIETAPLTEAEAPALAKVWDNPEDAGAYGDADGGTMIQVQAPPDLSLESVPDEQLAALFAEADKRQAEGFLLKCRIVHTFRERHVQAWGESWTESAYELFHVSRRTLNAYANLHEILDTSDRYLIEQIAPLTDSKGLMTYIGRKKVEEGGKALEAAVAHQAEFGEPPTVKSLMHKLGEESKPPEPLYPCEFNNGRHIWETRCRDCGLEKNPKRGEERT